MNYSKALFWGFMTYSATFFVWSVLFVYGLASGLGAQIVGYLVIFIFVWIATQFCNPATAINAFAYGFVFAIIHSALDALILLPTVGLSGFFTPFVWIGYVVVMIASVASVFYSKLVQGSAVGGRPIMQ